MGISSCRAGWCGLIGVLLWLATHGAAGQSLPLRRFTPVDGLPASSVGGLCQDTAGRLWGATSAGVFCYDGQRFQTIGRRQGLPEAFVYCVAPGPDGTLWFGHETAGISYWRHGRVGRLRVRKQQLGEVRHLWVEAGAPGHTIVWALTLPDPTVLLRLDLGPRDTTARTFSAAALGLAPAPLMQVGPGPRGQVWVSGRGGTVALDAATLRPLPAALPAELRTLPAGRYVKVGENRFWLATRRGLLALTRHSSAAAWETRWYGAAEGLCSDLVMDVAATADGIVWVFTTEGLARLAGERFECLGGLGGPLAGEREQAMLADREGNVWIGQATGLTQHPVGARFARFGPEADGLPTADIMAVAPAPGGTLWLGTSNGLVRFEPGKPGKTRSAIIELPKSWNNPMVTHLWADVAGGLWATGYQNGAAYRPPGGQWQPLPLPDGVSVVGPTPDTHGRMWFGSLDDGRLWVFDPATRHLKRLNGPRAGAAPAGVNAMRRDPAGTIWVGMNRRGLLRLDTDRDTLLPVAGWPPGRIDVKTLTADAHQCLWLGLEGDRTGLFRYAAGRLSGPLGGFETAPAFIEPGPSGELFIGTVRGLVVRNLTTGAQRTYGRADDYPGGECNTGAAWTAPDGRLWFGTVNGLVRFDPRRPVAAPVPPTALITSLRVGRRDTLAQSGLELASTQNDLTLRFVGVHLAAPAQVRYQYRLRGLQTDWQPLTALAEASFPGLAPGDYRFEVRAVTGDGRFSPRPAVLTFSIRPPWWRTWWAALGYAGLLGAGVWGARRRIGRRERERAERELERRSLANLRELDRLKTDFFTNISHEFRTPLTLILGPAEQLRAAPESRAAAGLITKQAHKLLTLINQLLDLSKLEAGALRLQPVSADVAAAVRLLVATFESFAESRGVRLRAELPDAPVLLTFDPARLEEMLANLLSNALKFTPAGGEVTVALTTEAPTAAAPRGSIGLHVRDTGPGIPAAQQARLFERFYQATDTAAPAGRPGTGVGLALVRELATLHGGTVSVASTPGHGATFSVWLPVGFLTADAAGAVPTRVSAAPLPADEAPAETPPAPVADDAPLVLLVEDNAEVRAFVEQTLRPLGYRLLLAPDGERGLALAREAVPDLVVTDVMMPGTIDGYQLCAHLKADPATDHIPVVLLTARAAAPDKVAGLETGADAFVAKPFVPRELQAQVRNLLALRARVRERFAGAPGVAVEPAATASTDPLATHLAAVAALPSAEQVFLRKLEGAIEAHLDDEAFGVEELAAAVALSRTQLHRKLKALTGQSPGDCIRQTRLLRAFALLRQRVGTVAEVGYRVGFSSPATFSTAFSRQFGFPPSEVAADEKTSDSPTISN